MIIGPQSKKRPVDPLDAQPPVAKRAKRSSNSNVDDAAATNIDTTTGPPKLVPSRTAFEATSQRLRWTFSVDGLQELRREVNETAIDFCHKNWELEKVSLYIPVSSMQHSALWTAHMPGSTDART